MDKELDALKRRVIEAPVTYRDLAQRAGVTESWLRMFAQGGIPEPSYPKVKRLLRAMRWAESRR